jgi:adenine deaminase
VAEVAAGMNELVRAARELGSPLSDPFMTLSFLALPPIPELKISDKGLVNMQIFDVVPLFVRD